MGSGKSKVEMTPAVELMQHKFHFDPKTLNRIYEVFHAVDEDNGGSIDITEFHVMFEERNSPFLRHLFEIMDENNDNSLSFSEFIDVVGTFSLYGEHDILEFAFRTFDANGDGVIDEAEFHELLEAMKKQQGDKDEDAAFPTAVRKALQQFDVDGDGQISMEEFTAMHESFPQLLWPLFRLQYHIQEKTLGLGFWKKHREKLLSGAFNDVYSEEGGSGMCNCVCLPSKASEKRRIHKTHGSQTSIDRVLTARQGNALVHVAKRTGSLTDLGSIRGKTLKKAQSKASLGVNSIRRKRKDRVRPNGGGLKRGNTSRRGKVGEAETGSFRRTNTVSRQRNTSISSSHSVLSTDDTTPRRTLTMASTQPIEEEEEERRREEDVEKDSGEDEVDEGEGEDERETSRNSRPPTLSIREPGEPGSGGDGGGGSSPMTPSPFSTSPGGARGNDNVDTTEIEEREMNDSDLERELMEEIAEEERKAEERRRKKEELRNRLRTKTKKLTTKTSAPKFSSLTSQLMKDKERKGDRLGADLHNKYDYNTYTPGSARSQRSARSHRSRSRSRSPSPNPSPSPRMGNGGRKYSHRRAVSTYTPSSSAAPTNSNFPTGHQRNLTYQYDSYYQGQGQPPPVPLSHPPYSPVPTGYGYPPPHPPPHASVYYNSPPPPQGYPPHPQYYNPHQGYNYPVPPPQQQQPQQYGVPPPAQGHTQSHPHAPQPDNRPPRLNLPNQVDS